MVAANLLAVENGKNVICNIGTGVETSDQEIFDILAELLEYKGTPRYATVRKGEILRICLDYSRALKELDWQPRVSLKQGLSQTVAYYKGIGR